MLGPLMMTRERYNSPSYDISLLWVVLSLLAFGMVMVYSASIAYADASKMFGHNSTYFLMRQALYIAVGLVAAVVVFQVPMAWWQKMSPYLFVFGIVLLVLVLIPGIGKVVNGSRRWISLLVMNLQPSELMKLFIAMYASDYAVRKASSMHSFTKGFLPMLGVMVFVGVLLLREPDFGAFAVTASIAFSIMWLGGVHIKIFLAMLAALPLAVVGLVVMEPYRLERMKGFLNPFDDPFDTGYQLSHALIAFGRGEFWGVGLGGSVEKLLYLPEAHTDFLLAVVAEELGYVGVMVVVLLFAWVVIRAFSIAKEAVANERYYAALLAQGIGVWMGVQGFINMGVNMGLLPTKGLTLPLLSYGGSGILANCIAMAVLLRIDFENRRLQKGLQT
ncbi:MAG: putative lipid II flippase FtsW [Methylophilus sp.]